MQPRRRQDDRSSEMRDRLVRATVECLTKVGYERTTTVKIAEYAGVTRGALLHHFDSKRELIVCAMQSLLADHAGRIHAVAEKVRTGKLGLDAFLDFLWDDYSGEFFFAWLESITESRHDDELRQQLIPLVQDYHRALDQTWRHFFAKSPLSTAEVSIALNQSLCLLRGMGLQTVLRSDPEYYANLLRSWKKTLRQMIQVKPERARS